MWKSQASLTSLTTCSGQGMGSGLEKRADSVRTMRSDRALLVLESEKQSQGALGARSAWKEHPCHLRHLGKVDQPPQLRSQPWNQSLALVCRGPQPLGAPLSEDELSEELGELVTLSPSGFQVEASPYRATVDRV